MTRVRALPGLEVAGYRRHMLHEDERLWVEKNCYIDVFIEVLHALRLEPLAVLGFCAAVDFEGDNFTFFKPPHNELRTLFGLDVQELNVWLPLVQHTTNHLAEGKFLSTEADSFYLPDTAGTDYRRNHVKTTIVMADVDVGQRRLGYFHSASYYTLEGEDFEKVFRIGAPADPPLLPLFAELIRVDRLVHRPQGELGAMARALLGPHVAQRAAVNPITRFRQRFEQDLAWIQERGLNFYHAWAFATVRQLGAAFELLGLHLQWLIAAGQGEGFAEPAEDFLRLSGTAKTFILKAARAVNARKPLDASGTFDDMALAWERGMTSLAGRLG